MSDIDTLKIQLKHKDDVLHRKNLELDALHYVWCDGGCPGGTHRYTDDEITEEMVQLAERNTKRLRSWFNNKECKRKYYENQNKG